MIVFLINEKKKDNIQKFNVLVRRGQYPVREIYITQKTEIPEVFFKLSKIVIIDGTAEGYERHITQFSKTSKALIIVISNEMKQGIQNGIVWIQMQEENEFENLIRYNYERLDRLQIGSYLVWEELMIGYDGSVYGNEKKLYLSKRETKFFIELIKSRIGHKKAVKKNDKQNVAELVSRIRKKIEQIQLPCSILCKKNGVYEVFWF